MSLVSPKMFTEGDLFIPNAETLNSGEAVNSDLWAVIIRHERELLINVLGEEQYTDHLKVVSHVTLDWYGNTYLTDGCNILKTEGGSLLVTPDVVEHSYGVSGDVNVTITPDDWRELYFGKGQLQRLCKLYIYCKWLEKDEIKEGVLGYGKIESDGVTIADNSQKYVNRWNEFVHVWYHETYRFLGTHPKFNQNGQWIARTNSSFGFFPEPRNSFGI